MKFIQEFPSIKSAQRYLKQNGIISSVSGCVNGHRKSAGGFIWKFKNEV